MDLGKIPALSSPHPPGVVVLLVTDPSVPVDQVSVLSQDSPLLTVAHMLRHSVTSDEGVELGHLGGLGDGQELLRAEMLLPVVQFVGEEDTGGEV